MVRVKSNCPFNFPWKPQCFTSGFLVTGDKAILKKKKSHLKKIELHNEKEDLGEITYCSLESSME